jgi:aldehyde dehydrogenase (NAD+)
MTYRGEGSLRSPDRLFIDGKWVKPSSDDTFQVINPSTEEPLVRVALAQDADIARAVDAAHRAFYEGPWPTTPPQERADVLRRIADKLEVRAHELSWMRSGEMGVIYSASTHMTQSDIGYFRSFADVGDKYEWVERHRPTSAGGVGISSTGGGVGLLAREPVGVVGAIVPWNGPLTLIACKIGPALLAGCTVVLKASPEAPYAALAVAEVVEDLGLPPGVVNVVTADRGPSEALVRDPRVDKITFTGSTAVGRRISAICADRIGRVTLELGGKSAAIVLDDYDVNEAAQRIARFAIRMTGQVCSSLTRIIVSRSRHDEMVEALSHCFAKVRVGDARNLESEMGPLAMRRQLDRVQNYVKTAVAEGAVLAHGGGRPAGLDRGFFIEPTVFGHVDNHSTIAREEVFGPVLSVIPADSEQHAVQMANDTIYGLNNSIFTSDIDHAYQIARRLRSGTVGHNLFRGDMGISFGGFKQSGIGREGLVEGLSEFVESKTIILDGEPHLN